MRTYKSVLLRTLIFCFLPIALLSCSSGDSSTPKDLSNRINVLSSDAAILEPTGEQNQYILTFNKVLPEVVWYTDRPSRDTGVYLMSTFILSVWPSEYGDENPNAILQFNMPNTEVTEGCFLNIRNPVYHEDNEILTFDVTMLQSTLDNESTTPLEALEVGDAVITIVNSISTEKRASSYVQYCERATVELIPTTNSTSSSKAYIMTLHEPDSEVFQVDSAPSRYSSIMSDESFIEIWDNIFADSLPNASLVGTSYNNTLELYLFTLSTPVYNASNHSITYIAVPLSDEPLDYSELNSAVLLVDTGTGIPAIEIKGNKMYYSNSKDANGKYRRFIPRGVAYQPEDNTDPISDDKFETINDKLVPMLKDLNVNSIRVYQVNASLSHDKVMELLANNNIYVFVGLADGLGCAIDRNSPQWTSSLYDCMSKKIDTFQKYENVLAFSVGNEVWEQGADTYGIASALKAAVRDMKSYIKGKHYRQIPVGMVSRDDPSTTYPNVQYSACQYGEVTDANPDNSADFVGYNMERWNSPGQSFHAYDTFINLITENSFNIPAVFTECGVPYDMYYPIKGQSVRDWSQMKYIDTDAQFPTTPSTNNIFPNITGAFAFRLLDRDDGSHWGLNTSNNYSLTSHIPLGGYDYLKSEYADASKKQYTEIPPTPTTQRAPCPSGYSAPKPTPIDPTGETITITVKLNSSPQNTSLNTAVNYVDGSGATKNAFIKNMVAGDSKTITIPKESSSLTPGWITGNSFDGWYNICGDDNSAIALTGQSGTANVTWHSCSFEPN
jgi:hypothetical protein